MAKTLKIKLVRSLIGKSKVQRATIKSLGLSKPYQVVTQPDNPQTRGKLEKVSHLVEVEQGE